jgi:hypothetical protein
MTEALASLRDRRLRRAIAKRARSLANQRVIVNVCSLAEALVDPRIGHGVGELLALSAGTAMGATQERQCFVCCRPWAPAVAPLGVIVMEIIGSHDALLSLICQGCFTGGADQRVLTALQRDLGCPPESVRLIHDPAEAD